MMRSIRLATILSLALSAGGCAVTPKPVENTADPELLRAKQAAAPDSERAAAAAASPATAPPETQAAPLATASSPPLDVWQRLRRGFAFARCDADSETVKWQKTYSRSPKHFTAMMQRSLPFLVFVTGELERRRLPTEFALLPIIESQYTPFATTGNRPAGMWQIMPATARGRGLTIDASYDGRLDTYAATQVALDLLFDHGQRFGDWRLANMAYNAGEYRVERAIRDARLRHPNPQPRQLPVSPITHAHLAKLNAVACIVKKPRRFKVQLPVVSPDDLLEAVALDSALDTALAAKFAGTDLKNFRRWNPAFRGPTITPGRTILLPSTRRERFAEQLAAVPAAQRTGLRARAAGIPHPANPSTAATYVVRGGDSLWRIARQFKVSIDSLLEWNGLRADSLLRPGQRLQIAGGG